MEEVFEKNGTYITQQGLKYMLDNEMMNEIEEKGNLNALASIEMGVEGRISFVSIIIFGIYIYLSIINRLTLVNGLIVSILIPGCFYYIFDYLCLYKVPMLSFFLRIVGIICFNSFIDKIAMLALSIFIFHNIWIFIYYLGFSILKYIIFLLSSAVLGKKYILFTRKLAVRYNNKIGAYFLKLFN